MSRLKKLGLSVMTNFLAQGVSMILAVIALPVYIHYLGVSGYGIYSFLLVILNYLAFLDLGLNAGVIRFVAEAFSVNDHEKVRKVIGTVSRVYLLTASFGSIMVFVCSEFIVNNLLNNIPPNLITEATFFFQLGAIAFFLNMYLIFLTGLQTAIQKQYLSNSVRFTGDSLRLAAGMVLLINGFGLTSVILSNIIVSVIIISILYFSAKRELGRFSLFYPFDKVVFKEIFSFSGLVLAGTVVGILALQSNQLIIGLFLPVAMVAFYSGAFDTTNKLYIFPKNLIAPLYPLWIEMKVKGEDQKIEQLLQRTIKFTGLPVIILCVPLFLEAKNLLSLWISPSFSHNTSLSFQILIPGILISSLGYSLIPLAYVYNLQKSALRFQIVLAVLNVGFCFLFIPFFGLIGAAIAFSLTQVIVYPFMGYKFLQKINQFKNSHLIFNDLLRLTAIGCICAIAFLFSEMILISGWVGIVFRFSISSSIALLSSYFIIIDSTDISFIKKYALYKFSKSPKE
ncbi:MAG: oligosaccharide flippase family protein [Bacteroidetes bacterium]|nr:oligosaccharide flippase family protein [Bacteroidota bacterium]